jgi:hypothetical protein
MFCRTYSQVVALLRKDDKPYEKVLFASLSPNLFMPHAVPIDKLSPKACTASAIIAVLFVSQHQSPFQNASLQKCLSSFTLVNRNATLGNSIFPEHWSVLGLSEQAQPTIFLAYKSMTTAKYSH